MEQEYLELLKRHQKLRSNGKSLWSEDPTKFGKLMSYKTLIIEHYQWINRDIYFKLINDFLCKKIDIEEYTLEFYRLPYEASGFLKELESDLERLILFKPIPCPIIFSTSMRYLNDDCRDYEYDPGICEISGEELIQTMREILIDIQGDPTKVPDRYRRHNVPKEPESMEKTLLYSQGDPTKAFDRCEEWGTILELKSEYFD
jgi:hypothetical protein